MTDDSLRALERAVGRDPSDLAARIAFFRARERAEGSAALALVNDRRPVPRGPDGDGGPCTRCGGTGRDVREPDS